MLIVAFLLGRTIKKTQETQNTNVSVVTTSTDLYKQDTDNDGLLDWEELLWNMNPKNPDTDGDGVLDGQEVETKRDQLRSNDLAFNTPNPDTQTEALAQQFYLFAATNPNPSDGEIQSFVNSVVDLFSFSEPVAFVSSVDVIVGQENPFAYYSALSTALFELQSSQKPADLVVISNLLSSENSLQYQQQMQSLVAQYDGAATNLKQVTVPPSMVETHVDLINSILNISGSLRSILIHFENDPTVAISSVAVYESAVEDFGVAMENFRIYFESNGIL